ncbi:MAG: hypothetical protein K2W95_03910 [Candidatus Obscuribacterales bacterium]|nr:hypothetical protein [Candidatus Obscuribacterales bacterium]
MIKGLNAPLLCALALMSACPGVLAADQDWRDEPIREALLLPIRSVAVGTSLVLTAPVESLKGGMRAAKSVLPVDSENLEPAHLVAGPAFFVGGAVLGPVEQAPKIAKKAWDSPFSSESFGSCE